MYVCMAVMEQDMLYGVSWRATRGLLMDPVLLAEKYALSLFASFVCMYVIMYVCMNG